MASAGLTLVDWKRTCEDALHRLRADVLASLWKVRPAFARVTAAGPSVRRPAVRRLLALGDVHGDLASLRKCLSLANVINENGEWIGGDAVVVQVGDVFDRGDAERAVLHFLDTLDRQARERGGAVYRLLGNHEVMNVDLDFRYVTPGGFAEFRRRDWELAGRALEKAYRELPPVLRQRVKALPREQRARAMALAPGCPTARLLAERGQLVLIIGDALFVHGGLRPDHVAYGLERLNAETRAWMERRAAAAWSTRLPMNPWKATIPRITESVPRVGVARFGSTAAAAAAAAAAADVSSKPEFLKGSRSPVWMRTYSAPHLRSDSDACRELEETLRRAGVRRMVVGHTPQVVINGACRGRVWRVDTGMSAAYGGACEVLEISETHGIRIFTDHGVVRGERRLLP